MAYNYPDQRGKYGEYGGRFVPETLMTAVEELTREYHRAKEDPDFQQEFKSILKEYGGRPSLLYFASRLSEHLGGPKIYLKREDLNHTGSHKINNALGQVLLARRMGKRRVIAETGAGQHGVAAATVAARFGLECVVYMGEEDIKRQSLNVFRMQLLGAEVRPVKSGSRTLKDATNEAMRDWVTNVRDTYYIIGSVVGTHPYPMMVRDFQRVIGDEAREQIIAAEGKLPDYVVACVGGGSNAMGIFYPFLADSDVQLIGIEAAGKGLDSGLHAASINRGRKGVLHGSLSYLLQDREGQIEEAYSVSAGLDYPGVGPEHSYLKDIGRAVYQSATDEEALAALQLLSLTEGIIPALESSHALAWLPANAIRLNREQVVVVCLSGRGDKDVESVSRILRGEANAN